MEDNGDSAELRGACDDVEEVRCDQCHYAKPHPQGVANYCKHRLLRDHGDPAAHFHIDNDCDGAKHNRPKQSVLEKSTGLKGEHDLPEIYKLAERGHDSERYAQKFLHRRFLALSASA